MPEEANAGDVDIRGEILGLEDYQGKAEEKRNMESYLDDGPISKIDKKVSQAEKEFTESLLDLPENKKSLIKSISGVTAMDGEVCKIDFVGKVSNSSDQPAMVIQPVRGIEDIQGDFLKAAGDCPGYGSYYAYNGEPLDRGERPNFQMNNGPQAWVSKKETSQNGKNNFNFDRVDLITGATMNTHEDGSKGIETPAYDLYSDSDKKVSFKLGESPARENEEPVYKMVDETKLIRLGGPFDS